MRDESLVRVQEDWWSWRTAEVRMCDLDDIHWARPKGAPQPLLYGFAPCDSLSNGTIPHECTPGSGHRVKVCILKKHVVLSSYVELVRRAYAALPQRTPVTLRAAGVALRR